MTGRTRVVVGIDGSDCANRALDHALFEAAVHDADLEVVHAWQGPSPRLLRRIDERDEVAARALVDDAVDARLALARRTPEHIARMATRGSPTSVLEACAAGAQQLVVGTHGRGFAARMLVGSVSNHCVRHAPTAVTIVPIRHDGLDLDDHIVVGVDGSEASYAALRWAAEEAAVRDVALHVVHAWHVSALDDESDTGRASLRCVAREDAVALVRDMTEGVLGRADRVPPKVVTNECEGRPALAVLAAADGAALLVLGVTGRSRSAPLVGSVTRHALLHTNRPTTFLKEGQ